LCWEPLLGRWLKLRKQEIIAIFCFVLVASSCFDGVNRLMPSYTVPRYFASPQNDFAMIADEYIPDWFAPRDAEIVRMYYEGAGDEATSLRPWLVFATVWTVFMMALWVTLFCVTAVLRRYWCAYEHLSFPLVTVPLYIAAAGHGRMRPQRSVWTEPLMWIGFAISFIHFLSIMLHALNPNFPTLGTMTDLGVLFTERPLNAIRPNFRFIYNPALSGLAYFAPQDLCFSMWFFFLFYFKPLRLFYGVTGLREPSGFPFYWAQSAGAFIAIAVVYLWAARGYLKRVWIAAVSNMRLAADPDEHPWADPLTCRTALIGAACGFIALCAWFMLMGASWWVAGLFFLLIILFATIFTRGRAESGVAALWSAPFWQASRQLKSFLGSDALTPGGSYGNLVMLGSLYFLHFGSYPQTMTHQIESLRMGEECRIRTSHITMILMGAMFVGLVVSFYTQLSLAHEWGANSLSGGTTEGGYSVSLARGEYTEVNSIADGNKLLPNWTRNGYTIAAFLFTILLVAIRLRIPRSPFHPLGFVLTMSYGYAYWGPFFAIWLVKAIILRLGGGRLYHRLTPVFVGLVMGQVFACSLVWPLFAQFTTDRWRQLADPLAYF